MVLRERERVKCLRSLSSVVVEMSLQLRLLKSAILTAVTFHPDHLIVFPYEVIRSPRTTLEPSGIASINNFTLEMRRHLAHSIGLDSEAILPTREDLSMRGTSLPYYTSLTDKLFNKFGARFHLFPVHGDGNCLYRALSHVIFGSERPYYILKQCLVRTFLSKPEHFFNAMTWAGISSEEDLHSHVRDISVPNAWGTNTELVMLGALARIDVVSINAYGVDPTNWRICPLFIHECLVPPLVCAPIYEGHKFGVIFHMIDHHKGMEHFDPFYM